MSAVDPVHQWLPAMNSWDYTRLCESIQKHGLFPGMEPEWDEHGNILDGHHRHKICDELGIVYKPRIRSGMTPAQQWDYIFVVNVARRHLTAKERRQLIAEYLRRHPEQSDRQVAAMAGATNKTVGVVRRELEATEEIPQFEHPQAPYSVKNRAETAEARRIQLAADPEDDDARSPVDAADHRNEVWCDVIVGYPGPPEDVRVRALQIYTRESVRREWPSGQLALTASAPRTDEDWLNVCNEIAARLYREGIARRLLTMDPEAAQWQ